MRVALVTGEYPPDRGGVADYSRLLAEALAAEGCAVDVLAPRRADGPRRPDRRSVRGDGRHPPLPLPRRSDIDKRITEFRVSGVWRWGMAPALGRLVARTRPDVLHIQYETAAYGMHPGVNVAPWYLRHTGSPAHLAVTYHDVREPYLFPKAGRLRRTVTMLPARWCHLTIATNESDYAVLADHGRPWRLEIIPIGSNIPDRPPDGYQPRQWRNDAGIEAGVAVIGYFGLLNASKGARDLAAAAAHLRRSGRRLRLVMIGELEGTSDPTNAAYRRQLDADLAASGLAQSVLWTGYLPAAGVSAWLQACDCVVLPYRDGWSFRRGSLLAAVTHGCPIVTTTSALRPPTVAAALRPLRDGVSALLVAPGAPEALAAAIGAILDDRRLAERLSDGARELGVQFAWPAIARRHLELYAQILEVSQP